MTEIWADLAIHSKRTVDPLQDYAEEDAVLCFQLTLGCAAVKYTRLCAAAHTNMVSKLSQGLKRNRVCCSNWFQAPTCTMVY